MLVVAVAGVLALVAYPTFMDSVRKGRRAEAVAALAQVQQSQERWRANNASYADDAKLTPDLPNGLGISRNTGSGLYSLNIDAANAIGYTATATATAGKSQSRDTRRSGAEAPDEIPTVRTPSSQLSSISVSSSIRWPATPDARATSTRRCGRWSWTSRKGRTS